MINILKKMNMKMMTVSRLQGPRVQHNCVFWLFWRIQQQNTPGPLCQCNHQSSVHQWSWHTKSMLVCMQIINESFVVRSTIIYSSVKLTWKDCAHMYATYLWVLLSKLHPKLKMISLLCNSCWKGRKCLIMEDSYKIWMLYENCNHNVLMFLYFRKYKI